MSRSRTWAFVPSNLPKVKLTIVSSNPTHQRNQHLCQLHDIKSECVPLFMVYSTYGWVHVKVEFLGDIIGGLLAKMHFIKACRDTCQPLAIAHSAGTYTTWPGWPRLLNRMGSDTINRAKATSASLLLLTLFVAGLTNCLCFFRSSWLRSTTGKAGVAFLCLNSEEEMEILAIIKMNKKTKEKRET